MAAFTISPIASNPRRVSAGGMVTISAEFVTAAGALGTPGTSIKIALYDPTGANILVLTAMTAGATGKYTYAYQTVTSAVPGEYRIQIECVDSAQTSRVLTEIGDSRNFVVE